MHTPTQITLETWDGFVVGVQSVEQKSEAWSLSDVSPAIFHGSDDLMTDAKLLCVSTGAVDAAPEARCGLTICPHPSCNRTVLDRNSVVSADRLEKRLATHVARS